MTNPLRSTEDSFITRLIIALIYSLLMSLVGGIALMFITSMLLPVGLGYWASAALVLLGRTVWQAVTTSGSGN